MNRIYFNGKAYNTDDGYPFINVQGMTDEEALRYIIQDQLGDECAELLEDVLCQIADSYSVAESFRVHAEEVHKTIEDVRQSLHNTWLKGMGGKKKPAYSTLLDTMSKAWRELPDLRDMARLDEEFPDGDHSEDNLR